MNPSQSATTLSSSLKISSSNIEFLKWIAIITMLIDHSMKLIMHEKNSFILYELGRISFPLFAFLIAYNYINNSKNTDKYLKRLWVFAFISQPFYVVAFHIYRFELNIFFSLLFGAILYRSCTLIIAKREKIVTNTIKILIILAMSYFCDYGNAGVLSVFISFYLVKYPNIFLYSLFYISILIANYYGIEYYKINTIIGLLFSVALIYLASFYDFIKLSRTNKWFFYIFYPSHLLALILIEYYIYK